MSTPSKTETVESLLKQIAEAEKELEGYKARRIELEKQIAYYQGFEDALKGINDGGPQ